MSEYIDRPTKNVVTNKQEDLAPRPIFSRPSDEEAQLLSDLGIDDLFSWYKVPRSGILVLALDKTATVLFTRVVRPILRALSG